MGCGKSSVGRRLSQLLCCPFMDLDEMIEVESGKAITRIFAEVGEAGFRDMEKRMLISALSRHNASGDGGTAVISLGGGTVTSGECAEIVRSSTKCIWLRASEDTLARHLEGEAAQRPMLTGDIRQRIRELMAVRSGIYASTAHIIIDIDGKSVDEVAKTICGLI